MNRRGFTLIELLAVIVILGVMLGIAYPTVSKYINDTRDTTYSLHEADMKSAAADMMSECVEKDERGCVPENGKHKVVYLRDLVETKYTKGLRDPANNDKYCSESESYVVITNSKDNVSNLEYEVCLVCSNYKSGECDNAEKEKDCPKGSDSEAPECGEVVGGSTIWSKEDRVISVGCRDNGCGCEQETYYKRFSSSGREGTITIEDRGGNKKECPVNTYIDKEEPQCRIEVSGEKGENGWYGNSAPVARIVGINDSYSGVAGYGIGTSSKDYNYNKEETYTVKAGITVVYGYVIDNAGNVGVCRSEEIKYDPTKPTITRVRYGYEVYPKEDMATKEGQKIKINNISGEYGNIYGSKIYLKENKNGGVVRIKSGDTEISSRTMSQGVTEMRIDFPSGKSYNNLVIELENIGVDAVGKVEMMTGAINQQYYTNKDVTVFVDSEDSLSGKAYYAYDGKTYETKNSKSFASNRELIIKVKDHAGNISQDETRTQLNNIDKYPPNCALTQSGSAGSVKADNKDYWYRSDINISISSQDTEGNSSYAKSGVRKYGMKESSYPVYEVEKVDVNPNAKTGVQKLATSGTGWYGYVIDKAGNTNKCSTMAHKDDKDPTPGTVEMKKKDSKTLIGNDGFSNEDVEVKVINGSDDRSGHYYTKYNISYTPFGNGATSTTTGQTSGTYSKEGIYHITVTTEDNSGRVSTRDYTFTIDKTSPKLTVISKKRKDSGTLGANADVKALDNYCDNIEVGGKAGQKTANQEVTGNWINGYVYTRASAEDNTEYTIDRIVVDDGTLNKQDHERYRNTDREGSTKVTYRVTDQAGNVSSISITVRLDRTTPKLTLVSKKRNNSTALGANADVDKLDDYYTQTVIGGTKNKSSDIKEVTGDWFSGYVYTRASAEDNIGYTMERIVLNDKVEDTQDHERYRNTNREGSTKVTYRATDPAGNVTSISITVRLDRTKPVCTVKVTKGTLGKNDWYTSNVSIGIDTKSDPIPTSGITVSGVKSTSVDGELTENTSKVTKYGYITDNAGNENKCGITIKKDSERPVVKPSLSTGSYTLTGSVWCEDNMKSGQYNTKNVNSSSSPYTVKHTCEDDAGNTSSYNVTYNRYQGSCSAYNGACLEYSSTRLCFTASSGDENAKQVECDNATGMRCEWNPDTRQFCGTKKGDCISRACSSWNYYWQK